ncbi:hypothetical protein FOMA001_g19818 [Fusarium oxysporum f. sp. matthiolae]|nr:hypothetical protein FOMA001_g19818 [Fusarium oxysporum f. sp. matthiolae]
MLSSLITSVVAVVATKVLLFSLVYGQAPRGQDMTWIPLMLVGVAAVEFVLGTVDCVGQHQAWWDFTGNHSDENIDQQPLAINDTGDPGLPSGPGACLLLPSQFGGICTVNDAGARDEDPSTST